MNANDQICRVLGLQPVHLAALFGDTEQISKLKASTTDFDINAPVCARFPKPSVEVSWPRGETPLMLATMMGHIKTVEIIIFHGAQARQEDDHCCTAAQFYTSENATQTHRDFYLTRGLGKEAPDSTNIRHAICDYLRSDTNQFFTQRLGDPGYMPLLLAKHPRKLVASAPFAEVNTGLSVGRQKEIGCLKIFNDYNIHLWAKSGFLPKAEGADDKCLDGKQLCDIARKTIAPILHFLFPKSKYDHSKKRQYTPDFDGRSKASHAEVQLSTAYILQLVNEHCPGSDKTLAEKLKVLRSARLGDKRNTVIYITSMPCRSCDVYLNKLSTYTKVNFKVVGGCGNAQVRRERGKHQQLQDFYYDYWQDSDGEADDDDFICVKCGGQSPNDQRSSTQILESQSSPISSEQLTLTQSTNAESPIIIDDSDEEYDSDDTLPDTLQQDAKRDSPQRRKPLPVSDIVCPDSSPEATPSPGCAASPVVQREMSNPFQGNFYIPVRTRTNFPLLTSEYLSTVRRSTSGSTSPAFADNTPCQGAQRQQRCSISPSQVIPKFAELAPKGPTWRHAKPTRGREGTDLSYEEPVRRKPRASRPQVADVYSVPSSREVSQSRSKAVSRSRFSRAPSVRPPTVASLRQQARVRKAEKRKRRASARTRGAAGGKIAPPTKSFRTAGLDLDEFLCQG